MTKEPRVHLDAVTNAYLLNRYIAYVHSTIYDDSGEKGHEKIVSEHGYYKIQWQNAWTDIKDFVKNPFQTAPRVAWSMAAMAAILFVPHDTVKMIAFGGAVTFDATASSSTNAATSLTYSHTCAASACLAVGASMGENGTDCLSGITYNAVAMTREAFAGPQGSVMAGVYSLQAPASGAHNVVISSSVSLSIVGGSVSCTGCDSSDGFKAGATNVSPGPGSNNLTVNVTSGVNDIVMGVAACSSTISAVGQTSRWNISATSVKGSGNTDTAAGATTTMTWTSSGSPNWSTAGIAFQPTQTSIKTINGLANASVKTINGLARASAKTWNGLQ